MRDKRIAKIVEIFTKHDERFRKLFFSIKSDKMVFKSFMYFYNFEIKFDIELERTEVIMDTHYVTPKINETVDKIDEMVKEVKYLMFKINEIFFKNKEDILNIYEYGVDNDIL